METYFILRWLHIVGATVLLGTGIGIAFFMLMAHRSGRTAIIAHTAAVVVVADYVFTALAVVVQPLTGWALAVRNGWPLTESWLRWSLALYVLVGCLWLPVVAIQTRMRDLARIALADGEQLPPLYGRLFRIWFVLGIPAFAAVLLILWLMIRKPVL